MAENSRMRRASRIIPALIMCGKFDVIKDKKRICDIALTYADMLGKRHKEFPNAFAGELAMKRAREDQWADIAEFANQLDAEEDD